MHINAPYYIIGKDNTITTAATLAEARSIAKVQVLADETNHVSATICTADEAGELTIHTVYAGNGGTAHHPRVITMPWSAGEAHGKLADYATI